MADERQRPEGRLIGNAIDASGTLSRRAVADAVGLSEARVRQIINGYASAGRGQSVEVIAPASTLARIALEVGLSPDDLTGAGRPDAADQMRDLAAASHGRGVVLDVDRYQRGLEVLLAWAHELESDEADGAEIHPPGEALWLWSPRQLADNLAEQVAALEAADSESTRRYFHQIAGGRGEEQRQEHSRGRGPAPMTSAGDDPAPQSARGGASQAAAFFSSEEGEVLEDPDTPPPSATLRPARAPRGLGRPAAGQRSGS